MSRYILLAAVMLITDEVWFFAQSNFIRTFPECVVTVGPQSDEEGTWFRVDWTNGQANQFLVPKVFNPQLLAGSLRQYAGQRLILRQRQEIIVIDTTTGAVVDRFLALRDEQSPNGRYLAVQRHTSNGAEFVDAVYSVYDLQRSATENRPAQSADTNAGRIVYPLVNASTQRYRVAVAQSDAHDLLSPFTWVNTHLLAFVDHHEGVVRLMLVDVAPGVEQAKIGETVLNLTQVIVQGAMDQAPFLATKKIESVAVSQEAVSLRLVFESAWFLSASEITLTATRP